MSVVTCLSTVRKDLSSIPALCGLQRTFHLWIFQRTRATVYSWLCVCTDNTRLEWGRGWGIMNSVAAIEVWDR